MLEFPALRFSSIYWRGYPRDLLLYFFEAGEHTKTALKNNYEKRKAEKQSFHYEIDLNNVQSN